MNDHLYEFTRTSFGLKSNGSTFIRCVQEILDPTASFVSAYVDDMTALKDLAGASGASR